MQTGLGPLEEAQRQAEDAAATLIERKFKEPANLEVMLVHRVSGEMFSEGNASDSPNATAPRNGCTINEY